MPIRSISGIRGVVGKDLFAADIARLGRAFGRLIGGGACLLAQDTRASSPMLARSMTAALLREGCRVLDLGIAPTPAAFREVAKGGLPGGICITASHNPPEWNGVKMITKGGRGLFQEELDQISALEEAIEMAERGGGEYLRAESSYVEDIVSFAGEGSCRGLAIAFDTGGGAACAFARRLFHGLGASVSGINEVPGVFARGLDPTRDELLMLREVVTTMKGCGAGFAYDCDGDRLVVVDEKGKKLSPDQMILLCILGLLEEGRIKGVAVSVDTTKAVEDMLSTQGLRVHYSRVGEANVVRSMIENACNVGGEGSSGGLILSEFNLCRDGMLASAIVSKLLASKKGISEVLKGLPAYHQVRGALGCDRSKARWVIDELSKGEDDVNRLDGAKIALDDDSWVLLRPSGTEDVLRISVESRSEERAKEIFAAFERRARDLLTS